MSTLSAATSGYSSKDTTLGYLDQSEQAQAASQSVARQANTANASLIGAAGSQENIYAISYSQAPKDPNNGNTVVHNLKFDQHAQGNNDQVYRTQSDIPAAFRNQRGFQSVGQAQASAPTSFASATYSAAAAQSTMAALPASNTHTVAAVGSGSYNAYGNQGLTVTTPGTNGSLTYGLSA